MSDAPRIKRLKTGERSITSIVTWNCNGLTTRCQWNERDLRNLVKETQYPDLICLQEVRIKARNAQDRGAPLPSEYELIKDILNTVFSDYRPMWSLADTRYSGTLTLIHQRLPKESFISFTPQSAIDSLLEHYKWTRKDVDGLTVVKKEQSSPSRQTSMTAFFKPKNDKTKPLLNRQHHPEGRFQFLRFVDMDVIHTYVPNNGSHEKSFQKRKEWDQSMLQFLKDRQTILSKASNKDRPLLWCGDLNCALEYRDGTHWKKQTDGSIYEWWTDEAKSFTSKQPTSEKDPDNVGIPSFTPAERRRLKEIMDRADLVGVWRKLHPDGVVQGPVASSSIWDLPNYTSRGSLGKTGNFAAKYQGKGQRLDYFLMSPSSVVEKVESCEILGYGEKREGLFCGSDHCACLLRVEGSL